MENEHYYLVIFLTCSQAVLGKHDKRLSSEDTLHYHYYQYVMTFNANKHALSVSLYIRYLFNLKLGINVFIRVFYQRFSSVVFIRMHLAFNPFQLANQSIAKIDLTDIFHCFCLVFAALRNIIITYISYYDMFLMLHPQPSVYTILVQVSKSKI